MTSSLSLSQNCLLNSLLPSARTDVQIQETVWGNPAGHVEDEKKEYLNLHYETDL